MAAGRLGSWRVGALGHRSDVRVGGAGLGEGNQPLVELVHCRRYSLERFGRSIRFAAAELYSAVYFGVGKNELFCKRTKNANYKEVSLILRMWQMVKA
jgi:hypothetical protein